MTKLSVNINKLATLRNSRGKNNPDVVTWAREIETLGAHGITVHPRPDGRHIRFQDVYDLKPVVRGEFNIEGYPDAEWVRMVLEISPHQATLVPDPPEALTSNAGFDVSKSAGLLEKVVHELKSGASEIRVSVFIDPRVFSTSDAKKLKSLGADRIELYTERFAEDPSCIDEYVGAARLALDAGLGLNAGHDLTSENLPILVSAIPRLAEVSIGHALICDALRWGMGETIAKYLNALK
ncbi:MAG: pyridoxine 5'-phosphate synthase [Deltaproteobacteria bacterium]|nr:pyridoxine 5'-phosphate synthase [Deltaproteobacteria bacterium]